MAQSKELAALRARLTRRGYTEVSITQMESGDYYVKAIEPLGGFGVQTMVSKEAIRFAAQW